MSDMTNWTAEAYDEHGGYDCMTGAIRIRRADDSTVATLDSVDWGFGAFEDIPPIPLVEMIKTAHMLAAAPAMYEALTLFIKYEEAGEHFDAEVLLDYNNAVKASYAAIDKAEGKT